MKQINDCKNKNLESKENCILEKLAYFIFNSNRSVNRNTQNKQLSSKVFFITLIVIYLSPCFVNAYAGNDAVYTIPSQRQSKQLYLMYKFPDDHDWGQKRFDSIADHGEEKLQHIDYDEAESHESLLQPISLNEEEHLSSPSGSPEETNDSNEYLSTNGGESVLKRAPSYNSWRKGKRVPSYNSWRKGKRAPSYNSWRKGKRVPSYSSWKNGKRGPSYSSWKSGKRVPSYNSWRKGKRSPIENTLPSNYVVKKASYNAWMKGKRAPSYNSWRKGKRGPSYNSWRKGKRAPVPDFLLTKLGFQPTSKLFREQYSKSMLPMSFYDNLVNGGYHDNLFGDHEEDSEPIIIDSHHSLEDERREKRDVNDSLEMDEEEESETNSKRDPIFHQL